MRNARVTLNGWSADLWHSRAGVSIVIDAPSTVQLWDDKDRLIHGLQFRGNQFTASCLNQFATAVQEAARLLDQEALNDVPN